MIVSRHRPSPWVRWLLAAWLVALPWFTQAAPLVVPGDTSEVGVEMPCHAEVAADADIACPHCAGDNLGLCKCCCSFAAAAALPVVEVNTHFLTATSEQLLLPRTINPPADHPERLYRPPIYRVI
jgi:hypothetical protein